MPLIAIEEAYQNLAEAMASVIEHPRCPVGVYNSIVEYFADLQSRYSLPVTIEEDAAAIRAELPKLCSLLTHDEDDDGERTQAGPQNSYVR